MSKLRFGIIGTGGMAGGHAKRINNNEEAELVALCDVKEEIVNGFVERNFPDGDVKPGVFTDTKKLFAEANLDAVLIASPHTLHFEHGMQALEAGCHIYMEKPMVTNTDQAYKLRDAAEAAGKVLIVGYNTPCSPIFDAIRTIIREERFGKLELVNGYLSQNWMKATSGTWRQTPSLSGGGQAYDSGAHLLNSLVWSVEESPASVSAFVDNHGTDVDINSVINVRFANNVMASIMVSGNCTSDGAHMVFIFEEGRIEVDGWNGSWVKAWDKKEEVDIVPADAKPTNPLTNIIDAIKGREDARTSPQNGVNQSELMDAIYESAETGKVVTVTSRATA